MREPWWLQHLKAVFLETTNVTIHLVFENQITYVTEALHFVTYAQLF